jgi:hypothetical protein
MTITAVPELLLETPGKQAHSETGTAPSEAAQPTKRETRPIPEAGPLAQTELALRSRGAIR